MAVLVSKDFKVKNAVLSVLFAKFKCRALVSWHYTNKESLKNARKMHLTSIGNVNPIKLP